MTLVWVGDDHLARAVELRHRVVEVRPGVARRQLAHRDGDQLAVAFDLASVTDRLGMAVVADGRWARTEYRVLDRFDAPAELALLPDLVGQQRLISANSLPESTASFGVWRSITSRAIPAICVGVWSRMVTSRPLPW